MKYTYLHTQLLPASSSDLPWRSGVLSDVIQGGGSSIQMIDDKFSLSFDFTMSKKLEHPYVAAEIRFINARGQSDHTDLSKYDTLSFNVKCEPANTLYLGVLTFDEKLSVVGNHLTYRNAETYFACNDNWVRQDIDLTHLEVPQWWLFRLGLDISDRAYKLQKVLRINIGSSAQSPLDTASRVQINDVVLSGHDWRFMYLLGCTMLTLWMGYGYWFFKEYNKTALNELKDRIQRNLPLVAYRQLSVEPYKDKEKNVVVRYMATEYANPELDPEMMATAVGVGKSKINEILKTELGYTFSVYLNKLRLTEAARLLEKPELTIAEIAYSVGYKNISYFNKLFKEEYNCTPKAFKNMSKK